MRAPPFLAPPAPPLGPRVASPGLDTEAALISEDTVQQKGTTPSG